MQVLPTYVGAYTPYIPTYLTEVSVFQLKKSSAQTSNLVDTEQASKQAVRQQAPSHLPIPMYCTRFPFADFINATMRCDATHSNLGDFQALRVTHAIHFLRLCLSNASLSFSLYTGLQYLGPSAFGFVLTARTSS